MARCEWYFAWWAYHHKWDVDYTPDYIDRPTEQAALRSLRDQSRAAFIFRNVYYLEQKYGST